MKQADIIKELSAFEALADAMKIKAAKLRLALGQVSGPAPTGGKKQTLSEEQRAIILKRRRDFRNKKAAAMGATAILKQ